MKLDILKRFPPFKDVLPVFAFTALLVYGRLVYIYAWKLPSWMMFLTIGEMLSILSYALSFALMESIGLTLILLVISFVLPLKWFRDLFIPRSVWLAVIWLVSLMLFFQRLSGSGLGLSILVEFYPWIGVTVLIALLASFAAGRIRLLKTVSMWFADQAIIFLFLFIPASLIGLVVVAVRNIFH
jgi:hypothetical protein